MAEVDQACAEVPAYASRQDGPEQGVFPAISVRNVTKAYRSYARPLDRLRELLTRRPLGVDRVSISEISIDIPKGQVVGIIGRNGAGKSTLLKMIAGRLEPTSGRIETQGAVAAILELGTGFHPDLSGRENVIVGGMCLGLSRARIMQEMQNIIDFSELAEVIDMPFRTYSSGMQARLTFATAITVDPDILIIDEALSVGDNKFQMKSFNRVRQFKEAGKTILLVTHGMGAVTSFCDRAILLEKGRVLADGDPNWVTSVYHHLQFGELDAAKPPVASAPNDADLNLPAATPLHADANPARQPRLATPDVFAPLADDGAARAAMTRAGYRYGNQNATIDGLALLDEAGCGPLRQVGVGESYQIVMDVTCRTPSVPLFAGFLIRDLKGDILFGSDTDIAVPDGRHLLAVVGEGERRRIIARVTIWLAPGDYFIGGALTTEPGKQSDMWFDAYEFRVTGRPVQHSNSRAFLDPAFTVLAIASAEAGGAHQ